MPVGWPGLPAPARGHHRLPPQAGRHRRHRGRHRWDAARLPTG